MGDMMVYITNGILLTAVNKKFLVDYYVRYYLKLLNMVKCLN